LSFIPLSLPNKNNRCTTPEEAMQSIRLEIYLRNGKLKIIETETPMDWHFWHEGQQVSMYSRSLDGQKHYALYDAASAQLVQELAGPSGESLPEWAKSPAQVQDESVPAGKDYSEELQSGLPEFYGCAFSLRSERGRGAPCVSGKAVNAVIVELGGTWRRSKT
jgi:hypothetical protein